MGWGMEIIRIQVSSSIAMSVEGCHNGMDGGGHRDWASQLEMLTFLHHSGGNDIGVVRMDSGLPEGCKYGGHCKCLVKCVPKHFSKVSLCHFAFV